MPLRAAAAAGHAPWKKLWVLARGPLSNLLPCNKAVVVEIQGSAANRLGQDTATRGPATRYMQASTASCEAGMHVKLHVAACASSSQTAIKAAQAVSLSDYCLRKQSPDCTTGGKKPVPQAACCHEQCSRQQVSPGCTLSVARLCSVRRQRRCSCWASTSTSIAPGCLAPEHIAAVDARA